MRTESRYLKGTRKRRTSKRTDTARHDHKAVAVLDMNGVSGVVHFSQVGRNSVKIQYQVYGMTDGLHGFHVHQYGDLTDGCDSACSHFNPRGKQHGGPTGKDRHAGDLGNVESGGGLAEGGLRVSGISVDPQSRNSIIGRSIILHADPDDLGLGGNPESKKTGNAGKRIACAVIGIQKGC